MDQNRVQNQVLPRSLSLVSRRSRHQLYVAIALILVIPLLAICLVAVAPPVGPKDPYALLMRSGVVLCAALLSCAGLIILRRYPKNIEKLREYLQKIANGELPEKIELVDTEDDIGAIQSYLSSIVADLRRQIEQLREQLERSRRMQKTIKAQAEQILQAERQRVMIESLGAACHHLGQPATVLRIAIRYLEKHARTDEERATISHCSEAVEAIADILERLRHVSQYRTVPYLVLDEDGSPRSDARILDIGEAADQHLPRVRERVQTPVAAS
ncbi:MAG: methyl-accepting chemotaxis protein [Kiritimatiellae bacterium]|nr:methyl-accepting chemotaxis protein [Kiritimatiellia bacterium]